MYNIELDKPEGKKYNVLWLSGAPQISTGFATVARNMLDTLYGTGNYDFTIIGINYLGDYYDQKKFPYKMYPARMDSSDDILGRNRLIDFLQADIFDVVFTLYDPFVLEAVGPQIKEIQATSKRRFRWIGYYAIDAEQDVGWVKNAVSLTDYPVLYCEYGLKQCLDKDPDLKDYAKVIYHGVDSEEFYPVGKATSDEFRRMYFKSMIDEDTFLITNVNRNQYRKDIGRTMMAFKKFKEKVPNSFLYLHMKPEDLGGSIFDKARQIGLIPGKDFSVPSQNFSEYMGVPANILNMIYNASDVITSTTLGEGFGLSSIEAMATKTLCVMPNNSALTEILGDGRGLLVDCGTNDSEFLFGGANDKNRLRPLTNVDSLVEKWLWAYEHKEEKLAMEEKAYKWALEHTWDKVNEAWIDVFGEAVKDLEAEREELRLVETMEVPKRNDSCPICEKNGKKIKAKLCSHWKGKL